MAATLSPDVGADPARLFLLDALRIGAAVLIAWHHFALYGPLSDQAAGIAENVLTWLRDSARTTQIFFVIGGFLMARSLAPRRWDLGSVGRFVAHRYVRLGLPYLAAVLLAVAAAETARGRLPDAVVGARATLPQLAAHAVFLQNVLGYESLSAGLWFVCINFQLGLIYVSLLLIRDLLVPPPAETSQPDAGPARRTAAGPKGGWDLSLVLGFGVSAASLFHFGLDAGWDAWALYFFPYFYVGLIVQAALACPRGRLLAVAFLVLCAAALAFQWRWRLVIALASGLVLFVGGRLIGPAKPGVRETVEYLGKASYSLFLVHFPILLMTATLWVGLEWDTPALAWGGLLFAFAASLGAMRVFHRLIEEPTAELSRHIKY